MKIRPRRNLASTTLAAYLEGEVTTSEAAQIEAELKGDADGRRRLEQLHRIREALSASAPELEDLDLVAGVRKRALQPAPDKPHWVWWFAGATLTTLLGLVLVFTTAASDPASEFRAKVAGAHDAERWSGIQLYRPTAAGPERDPERIVRDDGLLFSYSNLGSEPFSYLMIVGVDADGRILWFHPAYERPGSNPSSIEIAKGQSQALLGEVIHHEFAPGTLSIYGIFTRQPLRVREVEAWLRRPGSHKGLPEAGGSVHWLTTEVVP